jgi:hypothetical protein
MKEIFFKIIELPSYQVLLTKENCEDGDPCVSVAFFHEGVKVTQQLGYTDESSRDNLFNTITNEQVQDLINGPLQMLKG